MTAVMDSIKDSLLKNEQSVDICGFLSRDQKIYPLGTDTKVLSTVFELTSRPTVVACAKEHGYNVVEPTVQNHYPDFTLMPVDGTKKYIAIDVKTTYRPRIDSRFHFTLGGYTSFIRLESPQKNIVFPFDDYSEHWVIGFVYTRVAERKAAEARTFNLDEMDRIVTAYSNVELLT